jgi:hypothetical protein
MVALPSESLTRLVEPSCLAGDADARRVGKAVEYNCRLLRIQAQAAPAWEIRSP